MNKLRSMCDTQISGTNNISWCILYSQIAENQKVYTIQINASKDRIECGICLVYSLKIITKTEKKTARGHFSSAENDVSAWKIQWKQHSFICSLIRKSRLPVLISCERRKRISITFSFFFFWCFFPDSFDSRMKNRITMISSMRNNNTRTRRQHISY